MKNKETLQVHVTEDYIHDLTNVNMTVPDETIIIDDHPYN